MSTFLCWIWPYLCGAFVGWLAAGLLARLFAQTPRAVVRVVEKIVERPVPKLFDNPAHLERIRTLEAEAGAATTHVARLRTQLLQLQSAPPKVIEKIIDHVVEIPVTDDKALAAKEQELAALRARLADSEGELARLRTPSLDLAAAKRAGFDVRGEDHLEIVEGIGPKIANLLRDNGVRRFSELASMSPAAIRAILELGGANFALAVPGTWPEQSALAARNAWTELKTLQDVLLARARK